MPGSGEMLQLQTRPLGRPITRHQVPSLVYITQHGQTVHHDDGDELMGIYGISAYMVCKQVSPVAGWRHALRIEWPFIIIIIYADLPGSLSLTKYPAGCGMNLKFPESPLKK